MSHRADQIVEAVVAAIATSGPSTRKVFAHRRLSLSEEHDELPAHSVDFGEDTPIDAGASFTDGTIASLLTVNVTHVAVAAEEHILRRLLLDMRAEVHIAIKAVRDLGLDFVIDTHYGGANPPEVDVTGTMLVGELTSVWGVRYEMPLHSPE